MAEPAVAHFPKPWAGTNLSGVESICGPRDSTMKTQFQFGDVRIDRLVEGEYGLLPILDFIPSLTPELLAENRSWLQPRALDAADLMVLCFQSYVVRTPQ